MVSDLVAVFRLDRRMEVLIVRPKGSPIDQMCRNDNGSADIRARPMWEEGWEAVVRIRYDADRFTAEDVANLLLRVIIARRIIVSVTIHYPKAESPVQMFVSLKSDRVEPGGGYRETVKVLADKDMRAELLGQARADFEYWKSKYESLKELIPIFQAGEKVFGKGAS